MNPQTEILNMQSSEDRTSFLFSHQRKKEDKGDSWDGNLVMLEIQGIFKISQSRLKGRVCEGGMATMLIGPEFRMERRGSLGAMVDTLQMPS